ncbi:MAG: 50S ribosomal protein L27 [Candidatus Niyogibacteria bacterium RIFCSPLOWO2_01_FULL_45_48]|uniref:Large ribosomal subunit protein bL27 n=2 Tax=Candidatus Niyogiibacteriota TaxID=1817912 RepID=A0A1G2EWD4_9BACT|nr:MAG: 50S ribosomal protein L27 [Candidatus Niyogibacteria bacterium RIFCSPHIGHO2_01_FULL_45_28]OGZ30116.1 MAG: 50S ribosomal protein L27 [Candidatus Niyogibacteria bacterium RIFCSPLOWO2_02_FULL_45_13]OGZ30147.1 MAG: 50S ribosomal protein L27 [Candidatus Niyogibacteria bacterium RIFCSPLOWO2_01_FULL_45_48]
MAHTKAQGSAKNLRDSKPKYLGVKLGDGQTARTGDIIIRQRGSRYIAGRNVGVGKDYTLFALQGGKVKFSQKRKMRFNGRTTAKKMVSVV